MARTDIPLRGGEGAGVKKKWLIAFAIVVGLLIAAFLWLRSIAEPQYIDIGPPRNTESYRAYCAKKIERVKVVHLIPGDLNKPVTLGKLDPEFLRHARRTLDQFWQGEIVVVVTNNGGSLFPVSDREMTLAFSRDTDGRWRAFALLYEEHRLMEYLKVTASQDDSLMKEENFGKTIPPGKWTVGYRNKTGNIWSVGYDKQTGEFHRQGDGYANVTPRPGLFVQSLQDVIAGRCNRVMSRAIHGPEAWKRTIARVGAI